jgi:S-adenosylmethionine:tRNA ribosyltransferase-isomerase
MLTLDQFDYHLPKEAIAQTPAEPRDHSRLLVVDRTTGHLSHHHYYDLPLLLDKNTVLVRNNTKVIPARIIGQKTSGGKVEVLLTKRSGQSQTGEVWECLTKPGLKPNQVVTFARSSLTARCAQITHYTRQIEFNHFGQALFTELEKIGHTPIPPYIPGWNDEDEPELRQLYQSTYAKHQGSAAAPTAGLHFTPDLDDRLLEAGVQIEEVTLHVGLGTFLRVKEHDITHHTMHQEWFELSPNVTSRLNQAKQAGKKIVAVGTTTTRVLETCATASTAATLFPTLAPKTGETQIYIYPPYRFKFIDHLITNFHESRSTLLMLVSAFATQPNTRFPFTSFAETTVGQAYQEAIAQNYRLLSFGDGMLIQ